MQYALSLVEAPQQAMPFHELEPKLGDSGCMAESPELAEAPARAEGLTAQRPVQRITEEQLQVQSTQFLVEAAQLAVPCQELETKLHDSKCMVESP